MWLNDTDRLPLIRKLVDIMLWILWWVLTHILPNYSVCGRYSLCGLADLCEHCLFVRLISLNLCGHPCWHFPPPPRFVFCAAADIISTVEFNSSGELLATGDKGGRVVVFQREQEVGNANGATLKCASDKRIAFFHHLFLLIQHYHSLSF